MEAQNSSKAPTWRIFILASAIVIGVWGLNWFLLGTSTAFKSWQERAAFSDSFGAVTALFSGLAFAALIVALVLQTHELALQRQELAETRAELRRTADAQERTETLLADQVMLQVVAASLAADTARLSRYPLGSDGFEQAERNIQRSLLNVSALLERLESRRGA